MMLMKSFLKTLGKRYEKEYSSPTLAPPVDISWDFKSIDSHLSNDSQNKTNTKSFQRTFPTLKNSLTLTNSTVDKANNPKSKSYVNATKNPEAISTLSSVLEVILELTSKNEEIQKEI